MSRLHRFFPLHQPRYLQVKLFPALTRCLLPVSLLLLNKSRYPQGKLLPAYKKYLLPSAFLLLKDNCRPWAQMPPLPTHPSNPSLRFCVIYNLTSRFIHSIALRSVTTPMPSVLVSDKYSAVVQKTVHPLLSTSVSINACLL